MVIPTARWSASVLTRSPGSAGTATPLVASRVRVRMTGRCIFEPSERAALGDRRRSNLLVRSVGKASGKVRPRAPGAPSLPVRSTALPPRDVVTVRGSPSCERSGKKGAAGIRGFVMRLQDDSRMDVFSRPLVAVDGSIASAIAVDLALHLARSPHGSTVRFLSVVDLSAAQVENRRELDEAIDRACVAQVEASCTMRHGYDVDAILDETLDCEATCIVVGTHGPARTF